MSEYSPTQEWTEQQRQAHFSQTYQLLNIVRDGGVHELDVLQDHATQILETDLPPWPAAQSIKWLLNEGSHHQTPRRMAICTTQLEKIAQVLPSQVAEQREMANRWAGLLASDQLGPITRDRAVMGAVRLANDFLNRGLAVPALYRRADIGSDLITLGTALSRHTVAGSPGHAQGKAILQYAKLLPEERVKQHPPIADIDGMMAALRARRASAAPAPK